MDPRKRRRIPRFTPELIFILAAAADVSWMSLAGLGLVPAAPSMAVGIPTYAVFALTVVATLSRVTELGRRVAKLEQLLATDEADIAALSELPIALHPSEPTIGPSTPSGAGRHRGPIESSVEDAIAGYRLAGYTKDEANALAREVLRMQVKEHGGWAV